MKNHSVFPIIYTECYPREYGLSKREWFAGMIIAGMQARDMFDPGQATPKQRASLACADADALIAELEKVKGCTCGDRGGKNEKKEI